MTGTGRNAIEVCWAAIYVCLAAKLSAPGEDRTHDLQMALSFVIMRLTRYLLRYRGTKNATRTPSRKNAKFQHVSLSPLSILSETETLLCSYLAFFLNIKARGTSALF